MTHADDPAFRQLMEQYAEELVRQGLIEIYRNDEGVQCYRLTDRGRGLYILLTKEEE